MVIFDSSRLYIESKTSIRAKIVAIDNIIAALFSAAATAAGNSDISEYWLDDGQTKIKEVYKSPDSVMKAIGVFEAQKNYYIQQLNGHKVRLIDSKSFPSTNRRNGRC